MRILIDESLPVEFADEVAGHDVTTVRSQGWIGLKNGVLLRAATRAGVDVVVTADRSSPHQQNLRRLRIAVMIVAGISEPHRRRPAADPADSRCDGDDQAWGVGSNRSNAG